MRKISKIKETIFPFIAGTENFGYSDTGRDWQKCHCKPIVTVFDDFQYAKVLFGKKKVTIGDCHCKRSYLYTLFLCALLQLLFWQMISICKMYIRYLAMYVEAYLENGIHIDTLVPQNEPGYGPNGYPSMVVESWQEAELESYSI